MSRVLDASALLAFLNHESGAEIVRSLLDEAAVSAVNWAEVLQKALGRSVNVAGMAADFADMGTVIVPFTEEQADVAATLWAKTRSQGLSLADRACLALAAVKGVPVWTADRAWGQLSLGIDIRIIR